MRNHTNHRCGEFHHNSKYSDAVVQTARQMHKDGAGYKRIGAELNVPPRTVADWIRFDTRWAIK